MSAIGPITDNILKSCFNEIQKEETQEKIDKYVISPLMEQVYNKCKGIILVAIISLLIIILLNVYLVYSMKNL